MSDCGCEADTGRAETDPAYRRALWIVVILNVGFGLFELAGGFIAGSQALKADSLDTTAKLNAYLGAHLNDPKIYDEWFTFRRVRGVPK